MTTKRHPRRSAIGIAVSERDKEFIVKEASLVNASVSEFLRPGIILRLVAAYLGLTLDEAIHRLIQDEVTLEDIREYLNRGDNVAGLYRTGPPSLRSRFKDAGEEEG